LRECGWRKAETARTLGVARGYLHRLINQLGIQQQEEEVPVPAPVEVNAAAAPSSTRII
jgi:hypothetical protein